METGQISFSRYSLKFNSQEISETIFYTKISSCENNKNVLKTLSRKLIPPRYMISMMLTVYFLVIFWLPVTNVTVKYVPFSFPSFFFSTITVFFNNNAPEQWSLYYLLLYIFNADWQNSKNIKREKRKYLNMAYLPFRNIFRTIFFKSHSSNQKCFYLYWSFWNTCFYNKRLCETCINKSSIKELGFGWSIPTLSHF